MTPRRKSRALQAPLAGRPRDSALGRNPSGNKAFTLVEILIVILILGIVSMVSLPLFQAGLNDTRLAGAASEIVTALQFAQATAMSAGGRIRVTVSAPNDTILVERFTPAVSLLGSETSLTESQVEGGSYTAMGHPYNKGVDYLISLAQDERFQGVDITSSLFGGGNFVIFDDRGTPSAGGTIALSAGSKAVSVSVDALSGKVTTSG